jgi:hypothetical protein
LTRFEPLTSKLLKDLVDRGYVKNEAALRTTARARGKRAKKCAVHLVLCFATTAALTASGGDVNGGQ